jgi:hypothetical protein
VLNAFYYKQMSIKTVVILMMIITTRVFCYSQTNTISKALLIEKFTNNNQKSWFICGTLTKTERIPGDKRYVFSKGDMKFRIQTCNHLLKWETDTAYSWAVMYESENSPTGFLHFNLLIGGKYVSFNFTRDFKTLFLKLPNWDETCLR